MENSERAEPESLPRRRWFARNWLWFVPAVLLGLLVLCAAGGAGAFLLYVGSIKRLEPFQMALRQVQGDSRMRSRLGEPIEESRWKLSARKEIRGNRGDATLDFDVSGPKGKAHVRTQARLIDGAWGLTTLDVTFADGQRVFLDVGGDGGLGEAPKWTPPGQEESAAEAPDAAPEINLELPEDISVPVPQ